MINYLYSSLLVFVPWLTVSFVGSIHQNKNPEMVYICNSANSKRYHKTEYCQGLKRCKSETKKVERIEAEKSGRTLCGSEQ